MGRHGDDLAADRQATFLARDDLLLAGLERTKRSSGFDQCRPISPKPAGGVGGSSGDVVPVGDWS